jgi:hypothetical protein
MKIKRKKKFKVADRYLPKGRNVDTLWVIFAMWEAYHAFVKAAPKGRDVSRVEVELFLIFLCRHLTEDEKMTAEIFRSASVETAPWWYGEESKKGD